MNQYDPRQLIAPPKDGCTHENGGILIVRDKYILSMCEECGECFLHVESDPTACYLLSEIAKTLKENQTIN